MCCSNSRSIFSLVDREHKQNALNLKIKNVIIKTNTIQSRIQKLVVSFLIMMVRNGNWLINMTTHKSSSLQSLGNAFQKRHIPPKCPLHLSSEYPFIPQHRWDTQLDPLYWRVYLNEAEMRISPAVSRGLVRGLFIDPVWCITSSVWHLL